MAVVLSLFLAQGSSASQSDGTKEDTDADVLPAALGDDALSAVPWLFMILPFAAVGAFVLEWTNRKGKSDSL
jgi:hypothetical protein